MKSAHSRKELEQELKRKGIDVLFRQNDTGRIYGVTFIDHENRTVLNGSRLGKDFSANVFNDLFSGSRTLSGNSKQETQEHTPEYNPTGHFSNTGNAVAGLFSLFIRWGRYATRQQPSSTTQEEKKEETKTYLINIKISIMQNEDDLRGLAKVMDFMRAISILFVVINIYWFCYQSFREWGINIGVVDKILLNFQRTAGLFSNILYTKLFSVVFLALSCLGTKGVKEEKITWNKIYVFLTIGFILFFLNWWLLVLPLPLAANTGLYIFTMTAGYLSLLAAGVWISRLLKNNLMDDVFNLENESFAQETRLIENEYSINLPTRFYYKKKWNDGWINIVNPFRASMVLGTPGSGKSYAIVNNYIKQQIEKGFAVYIYDYKFPDLSEIAYNHLINHLDGYKVQPKFYMINFDDPRKVTDATR